MDFVHEAADVSLEGGAAAPAEHGAADGAPCRDDDVDAAVDVGVFLVRGGRVERGVRLEAWVLPDAEGLVEGIEPVAAVALRAEGQRRLSTVTSRGVQGQRVCDPAFGLEAADDVDDQVLGLGLIAVREDHIHVAAVLLAASVPAHDDAFDVSRRSVVLLLDVQHQPSVPHDDLVDFLDLLPGDLDQKLVIVLHADLLDSRQGVPPELDHVVEILPAVLEVELPRRVGPHAPDVPEKTQHFEVFVRLEVLDRLDVPFGVLVRGMMPFAPQQCDFIVAPRQACQLLDSIDSVGVRGDARNRCRVCTHADLIQCQ